ncbi:MAG: AMP-binding protein, partial [Polyangiaceae bacterium]|nr:AMP-binding protein [Polyangiaceae bacterium]
TELAEAARAAAKGFLALGIAHGDRVAIWAPNLWEWVVAAIGAHSVGGVVVPVNTRYKGLEAAYLLRKSRARALVTVNGFLGTDYVALLRDSGEETPDLAHTIVLRGETPRGAMSFDDFLAGGAAIEDSDAIARAAAVRPTDLADILFTSGTTGAPKGVMCTHAQNLRVFRDWSDITGLRAGDRYLIVNPFFHSFGYKAGWLAALMMGATILPEPVFDVDAVLRRITSAKASVLPGAPALYQSILMHPDFAKHDLSSLRLAVTGADIIPVELVQRMRQDLGFTTVITAYGLTETTGTVTMCRESDDIETIARTSGRAIPGVEVRVAGPNGETMPSGEAGEVLVRGYNVMQGYFEAPEETAKAIDTDGWLHTGDVGVLDDRGNLRITDRMKDMFIVGGFNAYPAEIEHTLRRHEAVAEVAVIGIPDARLGEVGMAFVVLKPGASLGEDELIAWSRERLANFKVPRRVRFLEALPRNPTGKVTKFMLRDQVAG